MLIVHLLAGCAATEEEGRRHVVPPDQRRPLGDTDTDSDTDTDTDTDADADADTDSDTDADPAESCHPDIEGWLAEWAALEDDVVVRVNRERARGADCGTYGRFAAIGPLAMEPYLRCAARYHSLWMSETGSFAHESPGGDLGDDPWQRIAASGFRGAASGENIAAGYATSTDVVAGWMASDGHCANIMSAATLVGVGYHPGGPYGTLWTQDFGY